MSTKVSFGELYGQGEIHNGVELKPSTLTKMDVFTGYTAGICIKLE